MLDFVTYENKVEQLAVYPFSGGRQVASLLYPALGLSGEASEVLEKVGDAFDEGHMYTLPDDLRVKILYECGDVLWYITRVAAELSSSLREVYCSISVSDLSCFEPRFPTNARKMMVAAGRVAEISKKALRDDSGDIHTPVRSERRDLVFSALSEVLLFLMKLAENLGSSLDDIAEMNIVKLSSRADRGVLQGSGDDR